MIKILFVCHGNICRSPMAEFVFQYLAEKRGVLHLFDVSSCGTSGEELGHSVYPPVKRILTEKGIPFKDRYARVITKKDYIEYDYIVCMEQYNIRNLHRIIGDDPESKVSLLLSYTESKRDVSDPWYSRDFEGTYKDVKEGCEALLSFLLRK